MPLVVTLFRTLTPYSGKELASPPDERIHHQSAGQAAFNRRNIMFFNLSLRTRYASRVAYLFVLSFIFVVASGCDGNDAATNSTVKSNARVVRESPGAGNAARSAVREPSTVEKAQPTQPKAAPPLVEPREVSFADAEGAFQDARYSESVDLFAAYTEQHETNPWGYYMLGLSAMKSGDLEMAETSFTRTLELDSTHIKSWLNLGRTLLDQYRSEEALLAIEHAFEIDQESPDAYRIKGRSLHAMGRLEDAADAYRDALRIDNRDIWSMNNLALILIEQERYELAIPSLARAVQLRSDIAIIYNNLGMALERTYRFRSAEEAYASAVSADAAHARAAANLARVKAVEQNSGVEPIDLERLALSFTEEISSWRDEDIARELPLIRSATDPVQIIPVEDAVGGKDASAVYDESSEQQEQQKSQSNSGEGDSTGKTGNDTA